MKIYSKTISENVLNILVKEIKTGKYKNVGGEAVRKELVKQLTNNPKIIGFLSKKSAQASLIKSVKKALYKGIGAFAKEKENISVKERDYGVYKAVFSITGFPKKIVDLGSGLNPLFYRRLGCAPEYIAYEIDGGCVRKVNDFFKKEKIRGVAYCRDILQLKEFPEADIYFMFKLLESVELVKSHKISERLVRAVPAGWLVVSFSTKTLSGKQMNVPGRRWFGLMLGRLHYAYTTIESGSEIFYIISTVLHK